MAGIFHALFGCIIGLLVWKLSEGKNGEKRYSLALLFIFIFNNYIGPDIGVVFKSLGNALGSGIVKEFYGIHSYFGFLVFALPYAVGWYAILLGIERARISNLNKLEAGNGKSIMHASYPKVLLMVEAGGIMHNFVDAIGHSPESPMYGDYYLTSGRFLLVPTMGAGFWFIYSVLIVIIAGFAVSYLVVGIVRRKFTLREKVASAFTKEALWAGVFVGVIVLNVVMMYTIMASAGLLVVNNNGANFSLGNLLQATTIFGEGSELWIGFTAGLTILFFFLCHSMAWRLRIAGRSIRADLLVLLCFAAVTVVEYALMPVIGNISKGEADAGALIFTWSTIGCMLVAFVLARDKLPPNREEEDSPPSTH